jgi:hypothetical protein
MHSLEGYTVTSFQIMVKKAAEQERLLWCSSKGNGHPDLKYYSVLGS